MNSVPVPSGFNKLIGYRVEHLKEGDSELHVEIEAKHLNSAGIVHGGVLATLLDAACGASAYSLVPKEKFSPTTSMSITYMNSVGAGTIITKGRALKQGEKMVSCEAEAYCGELLLAKALVNMLVIERRQPLQSS